MDNLVSVGEISVTSPFGGYFRDQVAQSATRGLTDAITKNWLYITVGVVALGGLVLIFGRGGKNA